MAIPISTQVLSGISWVLLSFALILKIDRVCHYRHLSMSVRQIQNQYVDVEMVEHHLCKDGCDRGVRGL